ncbi:hypothetical protein IEQ11_16525 [Lysobacter capsici]|uniref:hypothetical protein n=1 Tax=Lysobacter capsici TaxID=435897 RepID=UPI00177D7B1D|nr:hypothetical protein [Lysobacter capsici]UOF13344.1 hypothetical protein IEQ11_16525 [Lysobacter capsici]
MSTRRFWPLAAILFALPFLYFFAQSWIADGHGLSQSLYTGAMNFFYIGLPQALIALTCLLASVRRTTTLAFLILADGLFAAFTIWTYGKVDTAIAWFVLYLPGSIAALALAGLLWLAYSTSRRRETTAAEA